MTLAYSGSFNGYSFGNGARPGAVVQKLSGFGGVQAEIPTSPRYGDGDVPGMPRRPGKKVALELGLVAHTKAELDTLRDYTEQSFAPQVTPTPLVIGERQMYVQVLSCDPFRDPSWPADERTTPCPIEFLAADPTVYSSTLHEFDSAELGMPASNWFSVAMTNAGTVGSRSGRAYRFTITAVTSCTSPRIVASASELVQWTGLRLQPGQSFRLEHDRSSWVGTLRVDGYARGPGGTPFVEFPVLDPGANLVDVGCASGTCQVQVEWRDTW